MPALTLHCVWELAASDGRRRRRRTDGGSVTDSSSQGASIYILFAGSQVWKPWWRAICISGCLWRGWLCPPPSESRGRTLPGPKPAHRTTSLPPTLCPSAHPPPPWHYFLAALASGYFHYCVLWPRTPAGSPFIQPLAGDFQSQPRAPPHPRDTHTHSHTHLDAHTLKAMSTRILIFF